MGTALAVIVHNTPSAIGCQPSAWRRQRSGGGMSVPRSPLPTA